MAKNIDKENMMNILRDNYMIYAKSTIVDRSFPFIDGYKPVQRKVLYSMHELGLEKKKAKSARVVGDVMGKYHAHGDCVSGDTMIYQTNGKMITIEDAYKNQEDLEILCVDIETGKPVVGKAYAFRIGQYTDKIYHIKFSNGSELKCTSNHPILLNDLTYKKVEDIQVGDYLFSELYSIIAGRPALNNKLIQDIVSDYYNGKVKPGYVKHHKDEDVFNNSKENLEILSREEHAKLHKDYIKGLDNGRISMFSENGKDREETRLKNSRLRHIASEDAAMRRFLSIINKLKLDNVDITYENYEKLRGEVYNLPTVSNLIQKGYGKDFDELVNVKLKSVGEIYNERYKTTKDDIIKEKDKKENWLHDNFNKLRYVNIILNKFDMNILLSDDVYNYYLNNIPEGKSKAYYVTYDEFVNCYDYYLKTHLFVTSIEIENVDNVPMYDFTVDKFENMLIPMQGNNTLNFISIHNSSIYGAMCQMAETVEGRNAAEIEPTGCFGKIWSTISVPPAAMRYCVTGDSLVTTNKGVYKIKDLKEFADGEDIDIYVKGYKESNYHVSKFFDCGKHPVITIKLKNGMKLTGTYNHPVMVLDENNNMVWKLLEDINVGDKVLISRYNTGLFGENNNLDELKDINISNELSQNILNGTQDYLKYFLSNLFEKKAKLDNNRLILYYKSEDEVMLSQLQVLLLQNFEILSTINNSMIEISGLDLKLFRDKINFVTEDKKDTLDKLVENISLSNKLYDYSDIIDIVKHTEEQNVYSLKVDDDSHSFCANGFINHNTEAKLSKIASYTHFNGLNDDAVDFVENFDNTLKEPLLLPVMYPNIIVNTSSGVACGIRTYIPCYTLKNACEATIGLLNGSITTPEALADALDAPDFQTGGVVNMSQEQKLELVNTGVTRGIYITSRYRFDPKKNEITIYEIPYNTNCEKITTQIEECIKERKIAGVTRVVNGADKDGLGIVVYIQRGYNVEDVFKYLCAYTDVQTKISFQTKFVHIDPETKQMMYKEVGIYELLDSYWIPWRMDVIRRMNKHQLDKLESDRHRLQALDIVGDRIREYVEIVLNNTRKDAREIHLNTFDIDEIQEDYMLGCSIDSLTLDGVLRARDKINKLTDDITKITNFISNDTEIKKQMIEELSTIVKKFAIPRKSSSEEITTLVHLTKEEATAVADEEVWVGITEKCKLKKAMTEKDADNFASKVENGDALWVTYQMNNKDSLLVYTTAGCIYKLPVNSLDSSARTNIKDSAWRFISKDSEDVHTELDRKSEIFYISPLGKGKDGFNIVYTDGIVKKIRYDAYSSPRKLYRKAFPEYDNRGFIVDYDEMLLMTTMGRAIVTDVSGLLESEKPTKSSTIHRLPKLREGEEVLAVYSVDDLKSFVTDEVIEYYRKKYWVRAKRGAYDITSAIKLLKVYLENRDKAEEELESSTVENTEVTDLDNTEVDNTEVDNTVIENVSQEVNN